MKPAYIALAVMWAVLLGAWVFAFAYRLRNGRWP
jgi:hypothetical protein